MINTTLTPNATKALHDIFGKINNIRTLPSYSKWDIKYDMYKYLSNMIAKGLATSTMWDDAELFFAWCTYYDDDGILRFRATDLNEYTDTAKNLVAALDFYIDNRMWFEDFIGFKISKHMTTKIRKTFNNVVH